MLHMHMRCGKQVKEGPERYRSGRIVRVRGVRSGQVSRCQAGVKSACARACAPYSRWALQESHLQSHVPTPYPPFHAALLRLVVRWLFLMRQGECTRGACTVPYVIKAEYLPFLWNVVGYRPLCASARTRTITHAVPLALAQPSVTHPPPPASRSHNPRFSFVFTDRQAPHLQWCASHTSLDGRVRSHPVDPASPLFPTVDEGHRASRALGLMSSRVHTW